MTPEEKAEKWVENHLHQEDNIPSIFFLREAYLAGYAEGVRNNSAYHNMNELTIEDKQNDK